jgi:hypothetical protein
MYHEAKLSIVAGTSRSRAWSAEQGTNRNGRKSGRFEIGEGGGGGGFAGQTSGGGGVTLFHTNHTLKRVHGRISQPMMLSQDELYIRRWERG